MRRIIATTVITLIFALGLPFAAHADEVPPIVPDVVKGEGWSQSKLDKYIRKLHQPKPRGPRIFYPLVPSQSPAREFMINVSSKVLGAATPGAWQAEQLANQHRLSHSLEKMEMDYSRPAPPGVPQTPDDYYLAQKSAELKKVGKKERAKLAAPPVAVRPSKLSRAVGGVGGGIAAVTTAPIGFQLGNFATGLLGFDAEDALCRSGHGEGVLGGVFQTMYGVDCEALRIPPETELNSDRVPGVWGEPSCYKDYCMTIKGTLIGTFGVQTDSLFYAFTNTGSKPAVRDYADWFKDGHTGKWAQLNSAPGWNNRDPFDQTEPKFPIGGNDSKARELCYNALGNRHDGYCAVLWRGVSKGGLIVDYLRKANDGKTPDDAVTGGGIQENDLDPERFMTCSIALDDGTTIEQTSSVGYRESSGEVGSPECPDIPEGRVPLGVKIGDGSGTPLLDQPTTPEFQDSMKDQPDCLDGTCRLDLLINDSERIAIASCFDLEYACAEWFDDPNKAQLYECRYGRETVPLDECNVYSGVFKKERIAVGAPYSDPLTGVWTGGQSSPTEADRLMGAPVRNPEAFRSCFGKGWAEFNPVEWVFTPIRCGYEWAFVPRPAVVGAQVVKLGSAWDHSAPVVVPAAVSSWSFVAPPNGCHGVMVDVFFLGPPFPVLNACDGDVLAPLAKASFWFSTLAIIVLAVISLSRMVSRMFGAASLGEGRG